MMKLTAPVTFHWLLQSLANARMDLKVLETIWFNLGLAEARCGGESEGRFLFDLLPDKFTLREVIDQLISRCCPSTLVLYRTGADYGLKPLKDIRTLLDRKSVTEQLDLFQLLPLRYSHKHMHVIDLLCKGTVYQSHYTLFLRNSQSVEGRNERCFRKLKSEVSRIVQMVEISTGMRLVGGRFSFIMCDGVAFLQNIEECVLLPGHLLAIYTERMSENRTGKRRQSRIATNRELVSGTRSLLASPLRIRTPALTSPNSPSRPPSQLKTPHLPTVISPRSARFFNPHFKEMIAKTMERARLHAFRKLDPLSEIEEMVKDDEKFFEMMGLGSTKVGLKKTASELCLSAASTNESNSRVTRATVPPKHLEGV